MALGSNLGDRRANLDDAVTRLRSVLTDLRFSSYVETSPVDMPRDSPLFLNAAVVGGTVLAPRELLDVLLDIEAAHGRQRPFPHAPRTLDLDLILYGDRIIDAPGLVVPHPRFRQRQFVLQPLAEIAPDLVDPVSGKTIADLLTSAFG